MAIHRSLLRGRHTLLAAAILLSLLPIQAIQATGAMDADAPATTATPFRGLRQLSESERHTLDTLPWAGNPDPAHVKRWRQAWEAMQVHDDPTARELVAEEAAAGDPNAQYLLAGILLGADGSKEHFQEAEGLLTKAAQQGQAGAAFWLGRIRDRGLYRQPADRAEALYWYRLADALGYPEGAAELCYFYGQGIVVARDTQQALSLCQRAAERGSLWAMHRIGWMYTGGIGVPRDQTKAFEWMMKAAVAGMPLAERSIGLRYLHGSGTAPDPVQSIQWLARAADHGDVEAYTQLGIIYRDGLTGTVDLPKAANWFRMAATMGNVASQYFYGTALDDGRGVDKDPVQAYVYYSLAALHGYAKAEGALARSKSTLSSEEIERATRMLNALRIRKANE